jgi:hypothetical protein
MEELKKEKKKKMQSYSVTDHEGVQVCFLEGVPVTGSGVGMFPVKYQNYLTN